MRAYELRPIAGFDSLTLTERPSPRPGLGEVRVRVRAVSLNHRDLLIARGAAKRATPVVPASDGAGEVVEAGAGVQNFQPGDRVVANFFPTWLAGRISLAHHANALGGGRDGMLAEEVVLPATAWVKVPATLSFEEAAALPCAGVTAWHALFEAASVQPGDTVLLQGTGGVSIFALQLAKAAGARTIITSSSADKRDRARELGADHVLDYRADPAWGERAKALTGGEGVDLVVDVGGPDTLEQSIAAARYGGSISILGVLTGMKAELNLHSIFHKTLRIAGIYVGSVEMFERLNRAVSVARVKPVIDRSFDFVDAKQAYEYLASGSHFGKVVIKL